MTKAGGGAGAASNATVVTNGGFPVADPVAEAAERVANAARKVDKAHAHVEAAEQALHEAEAAQAALNEGAE